LARCAVLCPHMPMCSRGVAHDDADLRLTCQWPSLLRLLRLSTYSETGLRSLFMTELDKRLEQQQRAAGHANLFNLGAPLFSAYPSIDTRPADYVGDRVRVRAARRWDAHGLYCRRDSTLNAEVPLHHAALGAVVLVPPARVAHRYIPVLVVCVLRPKYRRAT
jgi:hypothetical protein